MSTAKWRFSGVGDSRRVFHATDSSVYHVATLTQDPHDRHSDLEAKARLVATAPELADALARLADAVDSQNGEAQTFALANAYAVLRKARGDA